MLRSIPRISTRSVGEFNPKDWINEGDGFMASSKKIREIGDDHRQIFSTIEKGQETKCDWDLLKGLPRASMLLLGYSVEMYLKGGLVKAYLGCPEEMFQRDVRGFSHKLIRLAKEIVFPLENEDESNLKQLQNMILVDARYPVFVPEGATYADTVNQRTWKIWSQSAFDSFTELASRIRTHSVNINSNSKDPVFPVSINVDEDGYLLFRAGGNMPPRITYRLSSEQKRSGKTSVNDVKTLIRQNEEAPVIMPYWEHAWIYEDGETETRCLARPN